MTYQKGSSFSSRKSSWQYNCLDGATDWSDSFPDAKGIKQSPININSREAVFDACLNTNPLLLTYVSTREVDVVNNGHMVVVFPKYKAVDSAMRSETVVKSVVSGGPLPVGHAFELSEVRFHWGKEDSRGSEHTVNFKAFPIELQLVHWNTMKYTTMEEAIGKPHGLAIVAIFIQIGRENAGLKPLTDVLEYIQYKDRHQTLSTSFHPSCLLPDPMLRDFWTYDGSFSSPPCSENVTWIIFRYPLTVSHSQMEEFRRLRTHSKGSLPDPGDDGVLADNFRPTQPLNNRYIRASFQ